ncbi:flavin reductase [Granulicella sp. S156]|uniref:flavin reductase n=1 Tax=Granulicella sp. S156 TaxID=1747224 RepID=UPI00131D8689|nr:flavin reductase [Granulicella sp. S156]
MSILPKTRRALKHLFFGETALPEEFTVGIVEPQTEIALWLHGMGTPVDVTYRYSTACSDPFVLCLPFEEGRAPAGKDRDRLSLKFCERSGQKRVLGEIGLTWKETIPAAGSEFFLFVPRNAKNDCLPKLQLYAHYLLHAYKQWATVNTSGVTMSSLHRRAAMVSFIRPHPVMLGSIQDELGGNIFPMNIMGDLGNDRFGFALKDSRRAAHLVERTGRIALSSVPLSHSSIAFKFAAHHFRQSVDWNELPFATKPSSTFHIPVPVFALRVRELEVEKIHKIGSHTFFVARILSDERFSEAPGLNVIHGYYQAWRLRGRPADLKASRAQDGFNKCGHYE